MNKQKCFLTSVFVVTAVAMYADVSMAAVPADVCAFGWKIQTDLSTKNVQNLNATTSAAIYGDGTFTEWHSSGLDDGQSYYGITNAREWAADFPDFATVRGLGVCAAESDTVLASVTTNVLSAKNCYCNITGLRESNSSEWQNVGSYWVFNREYNDAEDCRNTCGKYCAWSMVDTSSFRSALFANAAICSNIYTCDPGDYLNAVNAGCENCTSGYYCPGGDYTYDGNDQGKYPCPDGYNSDSGSFSQNSCYRSCNINDIANSTSVSGRYYYDNTNNCVAESCAAGWFLESGAVLNNVTNSSLNRMSSASINGDNVFNEVAYIGPEHGQNYYDINFANEWGADFENFGTIHGIAKCSATPGSGSSLNNWVDISMVRGGLSNDNGVNCWCKITGFRPNGQSSWETLFASWGFRSQLNNFESCNTYCSSYCVEQFASNDYFRAALFGTDKGCMLGDFNVIWNPDNGEAASSGMCTFDDNLSIPDTEPVKPGYRFMGWVIDNE